MSENVNVPLKRLGVPVSAKLIDDVQFIEPAPGLSGGILMRFMRLTGEYSAGAQSNFTARRVDYIACAVKHPDGKERFRMLSFSGRNIKKADAVMCRARRGASLAPMFLAGHNGRAANDRPAYVSVLTSA